MFNRSVVVVDEEPTAQVVMAFMLEKDGFEPTTFGSASAARSSLDSAGEMPCLVVVDVGRKGTHGLELARWVLSRSPQTGVVLTSTGCVPDIAGHGLPANRVQVLQKPFLADELRSKADFLLQGAPERAHAQASESTRDDIGS